MKLYFYLLFFILFGSSVYAQSFNEDKTAFTNFIKRMYASSAFEGVKIVDDYNSHYLVSVVCLDKAKYTNPSIMIRVSQVKAQSQASTFLNGSSISMDMLITTKETKDSSNNIKTITETVEQIKQNSMGFIQGLELLTNFDNAENKKSVFVYIKEIK
jgi:hypothetical protein